METSIFESLKKELYITPLDFDMDVNDFYSKYPDYEIFLKELAKRYQAEGITNTYLLLKENKNEEKDKLVGYFTICSDAIPLYPNEKKKYKLGDVKFNIIPSIKIGKLAVDKDYNGRGYGSFMIEIAKTFVLKSNDIGIACRFLTLDADVEHDEKVVDFYIKNGFSPNKKINKDRLKALSENEKLKTISMSFDVFGEMLESENNE